MEKQIGHFLRYMEKEKGASVNTLLSYKRDLVQMQHFLRENGIEDIRDIKQGDWNRYLSFLEESGKKPATVSRAIASMKSFAHYLFLNQLLEYDPSGNLRTVKVEKKAVETLTVEEMEKLMGQVCANTPKVLRDRAMLELLLVTGIGVSELVSLKIQDLDDKNWILSVGGNGGKSRQVHVQKSAKKALDEYLRNGRGEMLKKGSCDNLFMNCSGRPMSRQGFWKMMKSYGHKAGIEKDLTSHILRNSFVLHSRQQNEGAALGADG